MSENGFATDVTVPGNKEVLSFESLCENVDRVANSIVNKLSSDAKMRVIKEQTFINVEPNEDNKFEAQIEDDGVAIFITDLDFFAELNFYSNGSISLMKYSHDSFNAASQVSHSDLSELGLHDMVKHIKNTLYPVPVKARQKTNNSKN